MNLVNILKDVILEYEEDPKVPPRKKRKNKSQPEPQEEFKQKYFNKDVIWKEIEGVNKAAYKLKIKYTTPGQLEICNFEGHQNYCLKVNMKWDSLKHRYELTLPTSEIDMGDYIISDFSGFISSGGWGSLNYKTNDGSLVDNVEGYFGFD